MAEREGIYKPKDRPFYYVRTDPITGGKVSTGERTKAKAREWLRRRKNEAERREKDPTYAASQELFTKWCDIFLDRVEERGRSEKTIAIYETKLGHWVRILGEDATMDAVTQESVDRFVSTRRKEGVSEHTIFKECSKLKQMLKTAQRAKVWFGDLEKLFPDDVAPNYVPRKRALTLDEMVALVDACGTRLGAMYAAAGAMGLRRSEALKFDPARDLRKNGEKWEAHVRGTKTRESDRVVPVLTIFRPLLKRALPHMPIGEAPSNIQRDTAVACRRAGIEYCSTNDLRRGFCTVLLEHGVSESVARRLLGHSSDTMVRTVYGKTRPESLRDQAESAIRRSLGDKMGTPKRRRQRSTETRAPRKSPKTLKREKKNA